MDAKRIKEIRVKLGLSQRELAERLGVAKSTVGRWEIEQTRPNAVATQKLQTIATTAGVRLSSRRVVLFGAGASRGAGHILPEAPPLGGELYEELRRHFPGSWGNLPNTTRTLFEANFEKGMGHLWGNYSGNVPVLMRHMTLYLAQFRPDASGRDLFSRFVEAAHRSGILKALLVSTLNYDLLVEMAAAGRGLQLGYFTDPGTPGIFALWKLHGSCHFIPTGLAASGGVYYGAGVQFNTEFQPVEPNDAIAFCLSDTDLYPAMCLYMPGKHAQIGGGILQGAQARWREEVLAAERILLVGVKPNFEDTHIWESLSETTAKIGFVGSQSEFNRWQATHRPSKASEFLGSRWEDAFDNSISFLCEGWA